MTRDYRTDPTYRALLASVLAEPADDAPRLVLADWLDDAGECEWASAIRFMIRECGEREYQTNWYKLPSVDVPVDPTAFRWSRGFVSRAVLSAADWLAHASAILAEHPVTAVRLTTWPRGRGDGFGADAWAGVWDDPQERRIPWKDIDDRQGVGMGVLRAIWPQIEFDRPSEMVGFDGRTTEPPYITMEELLRPRGAPAGTLTIGGQTLPISSWSGPHPIMDGDPDAPLPMGVMNAEFEAEFGPPAALAGPTHLIDGEWKEAEPPNPMVRDERAIAKRRKASKAAKRSRARNRR